MKKFAGKIEVTRGEVFLYWSDTSLSLVAIEGTKKFFVRYDSYNKNIKVIKMNQRDELTKQRVAKNDKEYYTNILKSFILVNTELELR